MNALVWMESAIGAALVAGEAMVRCSTEHERITVDTKTESCDYVTSVDRLSQSLIRRSIAARIPSLVFLGEETYDSPALYESDGPALLLAQISSNSSSVSDILSPADSRKLAAITLPTSMAYRAICDPLDGTYNFVHRHYYGVGISIGLVADGKAISGVLFYPFFHEPFIAKYNVKRESAITNHSEVEAKSLDASLYGMKSLVFGFAFNNIRITNVPKLSRSKHTCRYYQCQSFASERQGGDITETMACLFSQISEHPGCAVQCAFYFGALTKFKEFLSEKVQCDAVVYRNGMLKSWDICGFVGILKAMGLQCFSGTNDSLTSEPSFGHKNDFPLFIAARDVALGKALYDLFSKDVKCLPRSAN